MDNWLGALLIADLLLCDECAEEPIEDDGDGRCATCRLRAEEAERV